MSSVPGVHPFALPGAENIIWNAFRTKDTRTPKRIMSENWGCAWCPAELRRRISLLFIAQDQLRAPSSLVSTTVGIDHGIFLIKKVGVEISPILSEIFFFQRNNGLRRSVCEIGSIFLCDSLERGFSFSIWESGS